MTTEFERRVAARHGKDAHFCHWPGCATKVPPKMWGCTTHWYRLPKYLRAAIWDAYVPGQEITKTPSPVYLAVASRVQDWILKFGNQSSADSSKEAI